MNELELLTRLRDEVPLTAPGPAAEWLVMVGLTQSDGAGGRQGAGRRASPRPVPGQWWWWRSRGVRLGLAGLVAVAACAAGVVVAVSSREEPLPGQRVFAWSGRPTGILPDARPSYGRASSEVQLVDYATRAAAASPAPAPTADQWVFVRTEVAQSSAGSGGFLFGPPDERLVCLQWIRVDGSEQAGLVSRPGGQVSRQAAAHAGTGGCVPASYPSSVVRHESLTITPSGGGTLGGWKNISYSYLDSLPTDPAALEQVILADNKQDMPWYARPDNVAIFSGIATLLEGQTEGVWIPPALAATMYKVLQQLPGVHFDSAADLAGRTGIGFYMVIDGWYKQELVIDPVTYEYMGDESVATQAHTSVATDGTSYIKQGQVLGWEALLNSAIVQRPGQLP